jgi:transcriptional regulator with XRE-family HTH domain
VTAFAERLKICRKDKGLTQKEAAVLFEVGERHWQRYESGEKTPTFEGLIALADYFGVSLDYLVGRSDDPELRMPSDENKELETKPESAGDAKSA